MGKNPFPKVDETFLESEVVILLQGNNVFGDPVYSYVKMIGRKLKDLFLKMEKGENFTPSDYGTVVAAGRGEPTQELKDEMRAEYNMVDIPQRPVVNKKKVFSQPKFFGDNDNDERA